MRVTYDGVVFVALLLLKLTHKPELSWWWVFSPLLIGLTIHVLWLALVMVREDYK